MMIGPRSWFADRWTSLGAKEYSAVVLSSHNEIRQLRDVASRLMRQDDPMLAPDFFLASLSKGWFPRVVVVYSEREAVSRRASHSARAGGIGDLGWHAGSVVALCIQCAHDRSPHRGVMSLCLATEESASPARTLNLLALGECK
jgi:hypothetical protein